MFGLSTVSLVLYGGIALAGAGALGYVQHLRSSNATLTTENEELRASIKTTKDSMQAAADVAAKVLVRAAERQAQAERDNRQAAGQIGRLEALLADPKPGTCDAAVRAVQALMP